MPITVSMIEEKEFKTKLKGYDPAEVDEFLDEICDEMVAMQDEIAALQNRLSQATRSASGYAPAPVIPPILSTPVMAAPAVPVAPVAPVAPAASAAPAEPKKDTMAEANEGAKKLLDNAQRLYDSIVADAKKKADEILENAKAQMPAELTDLDTERERLEQRIDALKAAAADYRRRFKDLVDSQSEILDASDDLF